MARMSPKSESSLFANDASAATNKCGTTSLEAEESRMANMTRRCVELEISLLEASGPEFVVQLTRLKDMIKELEAEVEVEAAAEEEKKEGGDGASSSRGQKEEEDKGRKKNRK